MVRLSKFEWLLVALFLSAVVVANLVVTAFGQAALPFTAFFLIPFDLVTRDVLHERWEVGGRSVWLRMFALVLTGGALSVLASGDALWIAMASCIAFVCCGLINTLGFSLLASTGRLTRMNMSNAFAALVDSIVFPVVAFGLASVDPWLCASQAGAKFLGGVLFSFVFVRYVLPRRATGESIAHN